MPEELPFDEGRAAYITRKTMDENPYDSDDWKNEEWLKGWSHEEETDSEQAWDWAENRFKS